MSLILFDCLLFIAIINSISYFLLAYSPTLSEFQPLSPPYWFS